MPLIGYLELDRILSTGDGDRDTMASYGWLDPWILGSSDLVGCKVTTLQTMLLAAISHISRDTSMLDYTYLPQPSSSLLVFTT